MRVALVHDWLVTNRGGEKVLDALCELFPDAEVFTLIHKKGSVSARIESRRITTSFLQNVPGILDSYRHFLPALPRAIESLELRGFDLVISSSHCVAKGVRAPAQARHLAYVHSPMRYMWDRFEDYFGADRASAAVRAAALVVRPSLQDWDRRTSRPIDRIVANSHYIANQVARCWGRQASVIHPPVDVERFASAPAGTGSGGYFLCFGALAPYKRIDVAVEAFRAFGAPLWIAGSGQEADRLRRSLPPNVRMLGQVADADVPALYRNARALVFPGLEDFGLTPIEAQACGRPVIAYAGGGALETVTSHTGLFFAEQTSAALLTALRQFEAFERVFDPAAARAHAQRFDRAAFLTAMSQQVEALTRLPE